MNACIKCNNQFKEKETIYEGCFYDLEEGKCVEGDVCLNCFCDDAVWAKGFSAECEFEFKTKYTQQTHKEQEGVVVKRTGDKSFDVVAIWQPCRHKESSVICSLMLIDKEGLFVTSCPVFRGRDFVAVERKWTAEEFFKYFEKL